MNSVTEDYIEEMLRAIDKLRDKINKYKDQYSKNEWLVRYSLIDPFLKLLGWDLENPEEVIPELGTPTGRPDYTLFKSNKKLAFIGAKKLGTDENINQHLNYCIGEGVGYFITTDGNRWGVYDNSLFLKPIHERKTIEWSILNDPLEVILIKALYISKRFFGLKYGEFNNSKPNNITINNNEDKGLSYNTRPKKIVKPTNKQIKSININGQYINTNSAKGVLINTFRWLLDNGYLKNISIPLKSGKIRYLVNTRPVDQKGKSFKNPATVEGYYIECDNNHDRSIALAKLLLKEAGLDPDILKIETW